MEKDNSEDLEAANHLLSMTADERSSFVKNTWLAASRKPVTAVEVIRVVPIQFDTLEEDYTYTSSIPLEDCVPKDWFEQIKSTPPKTRYLLQNSQQVNDFLLAVSSKANAGNKRNLAQFLMGTHPANGFLLFRMVDEHFLTRFEKELIYHDAEFSQSGLKNPVLHYMRKHNIKCHDSGHLCAVLDKIMKKWSIDADKVNHLWKKCIEVRDS